MKMTDEERRERKHRYYEANREQSLKQCAERHANPEWAKHKREYDHRRYESDPDRAKRQAAAWLAANPERAAKRHATYFGANRERILSKNAGYYATHREQELKRMTERYWAHRAENCIVSAKWRANNREKALEAIRRWSRQHPEVRRVLEEKRRSLKYSNTPIEEMLTSTEWLAILAEANGHCHYCGKEAKLTLDHVIPLSKGGKHSKENVVPACGHCNFSKGTKTVEEWNAKRLTQTTN